MRYFQERNPGVKISHLPFADPSTELTLDKVG